MEEQKKRIQELVAQLSILSPERKQQILTEIETTDDDIFVEDTLEILQDAAKKEQDILQGFSSDDQAKHEEALAFIHQKEEEQKKKDLETLAELETELESLYGEKSEV